MIYGPQVLIGVMASDLAGEGASSTAVGFVGVFAALGMTHNMCQFYAFICMYVRMFACVRVHMRVCMRENSHARVNMRAFPARVCMRFCAY